MVSECSARCAGGHVQGLYVAVTVRGVRMRGTCAVFEPPFIGPFRVMCVQSKGSLEIVTLSTQNMQRTPLRALIVGFGV